MAYQEPVKEFSAERRRRLRGSAEELARTALGARGQAKPLIARKGIHTIAFDHGHGNELIWSANG